FKLVKANGQWNPVDVWENTEVSMYMTNGVIVHDTFVALSHKNSGQFFALDARTGKTIWKSAPRQATNAAISRAGDLLFILKEDAELLIARSGARGLETVKTYSVADSATWSAPAVSGRRLFVKDVGTLTLWTMDWRLQSHSTWPPSHTGHHTRKSMDGGACMVWYFPPTA